KPEDGFGNKAKKWGQKNGETGKRIKEMISYLFAPIFLPVFPIRVHPCPSVVGPLCVSLRSLRSLRLNGFFSSCEGRGQLFGLKRRQGDGSEEAGIGERPIGGVERFVVQVDEIDVVEVFPFHAASIEVADAIGGGVGDLDLENVVPGFEG